MEVTQEDRAKQELNILKDRARLMGIDFSNNIGLDALREKIQAKQEGTTEQETEEVNALDPVATTPKQKKQTLRSMLQEREMALVRLRITNLDPKKKDLKGEILTVANEYIGNIRKMVPYGEATENGFHVPYCLYKMMKRRQFQQIRTFKKNGQIRVEHSMVREFALEVLPQLTAQEIRQLAASQSAAGGLED